MRAMVLAAGYGQRMRPLTLLRAKPALPVLGRPLVHWTAERLAEAGVREVLVNLHHLPGSVEAALGSGRRFGLRVSYRHEPRILGTGGGPRAVRSFFGDEPFLLVNGDVVFGFDLRRLLTRQAAAGVPAALALRRNPDPRAYSPVITDRRARILSIAGRPRVAEGAVSMFAGVHAMSPALLEQLPEGPSDSVRDLYTPFLAQGGALLGVRLRGEWYDFGQPSLYLEAQLRLLKGRALVDEKARLGAGVQLERSVVGAGSRVGGGARVRCGILWEDSVIEPGARVDRSIVAGGGVVRAGELAAGVIVLPAAVLDGAGQLPFTWERRGEMAWVRIR